MHNYFNTGFKKKSIYLSPGDYFVSDDDIIIETVLGSCISVCLFADFEKTVGMNHFMLPNKLETDDIAQSTSGRYGMYAMELLVNAMLNKNIKKSNLKAKVFGGGNIIDFKRNDDGVASNNIKFIINYLDRENIPMISSHLGGSKARKILFFSETKKVLLKEISEKENKVALNEEIIYQNKIIEENKKSNVIFFDD